MRNLRLAIDNESHLEGALKNKLSEYYKNNREKIKAGSIYSLYAISTLGLIGGLVYRLVN